MNSDNKIHIAAKNLTFSCNSEDTVLRAALRSGLDFPYECNSGGCGSCKFELVDGEVDVIWEKAPGLSSRDLRKGKKLACQCRVKSDCTIKAAVEQKTSVKYKPEKFSVRYTSRRELTSDMAEFRFTADQPARFLPGQYLMMKLPGVEGERAYSMSNIPNAAGYWQFIVKRMPGGQGSNYLFDQLIVGDSIDFDGPYGLSYLQVDRPRDIVCIAGGSGLSPVMSIVRAATGDPKLAGRNIFLFYGGRGPSDICTPELVSEIEHLDAELICHNATSDSELSAQQNWKGDCCFVHELVEKKLTGSMADYEFYFCGPPVMTDTVQRMLMIDYKVPFEQIHFDRFF